MDEAFPHAPSPLYASRPVIVVHLQAGTYRGRPVAACSPCTFIPETTGWAEVPRVPCPACIRSGRDGSTDA